MLHSQPPQSKQVSLLDVQNLSLIRKEERGSTTKILGGVAFRIMPEETLALIGESGSGKTMTSLAILKLLPEGLSILGRPRILWKGENLDKVPEKTMCRIRGGAISLIPQEPLTALNPLHTIEKTMKEVLSLHALKEGFQDNGEKMTQQERIKDVLSWVQLEHIPHLLQAFPHQLSGGERQRVLIALALLNRPSLVIADEPATALDSVVKMEIIRLLMSLKKRFHLSLLLITHDPFLVRHLADRICVMHQGRILETLSHQGLKTDAKHPYTRELLGYHLAPEGRRSRDKTPDRMVVEASNLRIWHPVHKGFLHRVVGHVKAVDDVSFHVAQGEMVGVVGQSGCGKSSLARGLLSLDAYGGKVCLLGKDLSLLSKSQLRAERKNMQIMFQDPFGSLNPRMSIRSLLNEGLDVHMRHLDSVSRERLMDEVLKDVGLSLREHGHRYPYVFSGGQRQRIALARVLVLRPRFLVMDEPTSALDIVVQYRVMDMICTLQEKHAFACLLITHDLPLVARYAHRILVMKGGKILEEGTPQALMSQPKHAYTRALINARL